jgi:hypothetical protein
MNNSIRLSRSPFKELPADDDAYVDTLGAEVGGSGSGCIGVDYDMSSRVKAGNNTLGWSFESHRNLP